MKVSFDFDDTLSKPHVQKYAKELVQRGIEVWIITSRYDDEHIHLYDFEVPKNVNDEVYKVAEEVGIPRKHIVFTNMSFKSNFLFCSDFIWHLDDFSKELNKINSETRTKGISVLSGSWKNKCEKLLTPEKTIENMEHIIN